MSLALEVAQDDRNPVSVRQTAQFEVELKEFFEAFLRCFFAEIADWFEFGNIEWMEKTEAKFGP